MKAAFLWEELYEAAILETDDEQLQKRIKAAKARLTPDFTNCSSTMEVRPKKGNVSAMRLLG